MPFDGTTGNTPALNRAQLVEALRNDTEWRWDFTCSAGCAIGMARVMWPDAKLTDHLGITGVQYERIFGFVDNIENRTLGLHPEWCDFYGMERTQVTPQMVADKLEEVR